jgi:hypothetical protein
MTMALLCKMMNRKASYNSGVPGYFWPTKAGMMRKIPRAGSTLEILPIKGMAFIPSLAEARSSSRFEGK